MKKTKSLAPRLNPQVAPREWRMDHNTVSRPQRVRASEIAEGEAETAERFHARGGYVQLLAVSWSASDAG